MQTVEIFWKEILVAFGSTAILLALVAWLVKSIITHFLSKDVEVYKTKIKSEADQELEALKHSLRMVSFEHEVRFARFDEKRAEVVAEIYGRLVKALAAVGDYVRYGVAPGREERAKESDSALKAFKDSFDANRIYLEETICVLLDDFYENTFGPAVYFDISIVSSDPDDRQSIFDARRESLKQLEGKAVPIRKALESEFRNILGVEKGNPDKPSG